MHSPFVPGRSQRLSWWWNDLRSARFSLALAALLLAIGFAMPSRVVGAGVTPVDQLFGLSSSGLRAGKVWQLVTHAFIHGGPAHLWLNVLMLLATGARVERIAGAKTAARIFVAGVVGGGIGFLALPVGDQLLVGASGGIFALLLWLTSVSPESRMAPLPVSARNLGRGILLVSAVFAFLAPWWLPGGVAVAHACHLGGAVVGWSMGRLLLRRRPTLEDLRKERARREDSGGL